MKKLYVKTDDCPLDISHAPALLVCVHCLHSERLCKDEGGYVICVALKKGAE